MLLTWMLMKGVYTLIIKVHHRLEIMVGRLGVLAFEPGYWVYVGSAMGEGSTSIQNRIRRHLREKKATHWHIDYLLAADVSLEAVVWALSKANYECRLSQRLGGHDFFRKGPVGFGASDCTMSCEVHLFHYDGPDPIIEVLSKAIEEIGLSPSAVIVDNISSDKSGIWKAE